MLSDIFSPVCLSVMSYIIFLRNRKTKNHFFHISYNVFCLFLLGFLSLVKGYSTRHRYSFFIGNESGFFIGGNCFKYDNFLFIYIKQEVVLGKLTKVC